MARDLKAQKVALDAAVASHGKVEELRVVTPLGTASVACAVPNDPQVVVEAAEHYMRWLNDGIRLPDVDAETPDPPAPSRIRPLFTGRVIDGGGGHVTISVDRETVNYPADGTLVAVFEDR